MSGWTGGTGEQAGLEPYRPPRGSEVLEGTPVTIANGATGSLPWVKDSGDDLLDLSVPTVRTFVATGLYAVHVELGPAIDMTAGGGYGTALLFHAVAAGGHNVAAGSAAGASLRPGSESGVILAATAGDSLELQVGNWDGVQALSFYIIGATVQRIA